MVRFEDKLLSNAVAEWGPFYVDYRALKKLLYTKGATLETSRSPHNVLLSPRLRPSSSKSRQTTDISDVRRAARSARTFEAESLVPLIDSPGQGSDGGDSDPSENMSAVCPAGKAQTGLSGKAILRSKSHLWWAIYEDHTVPTGTKWARESWTSIKNAIFWFHFGKPKPLKID